ncbi:MAG: hypothetical protein ACTSXL_05500 [Alphaproteobacteria bacterium]|nr:MAG: hypothetical protein B6I23_00535 [Rickettsiaceae bacterium 4572_127]
MKKILLTAVILGLSATATQAFFWSSNDSDKNGHNKNRPSVEKVFEKWDENKDDKLSQEEFKAHHEKRVERRMNRKNKGNKGKKNQMMKLTSAELFAKMDVNSDSFISQEEMKAHREMRREKRMERRKNREGMNN